MKPFIAKTKDGEKVLVLDNKGVDNTCFICVRISRNI
jgi:hypothetical protein